MAQQARSQLLLRVSRCIIPNVAKKGKKPCKPIEVVHVDRGVTIMVALYYFFELE